MSWIVKFRIKEYLRESTWIVPLLCAIVAAIVGTQTWRLDKYFQWNLFDFKFSGAIATVGAIIGAMITFTGFVFSILLVAVQFASAHLSPRVLKTSLNDKITQASNGIFVSTFVYSIIIIARIDNDFVPQLSVFIAIIMVGISIIMFLILINHISLRLQAPRIIHGVAVRGIKIIEKMYSKNYSSIAKQQKQDTDISLDKPTRIITYEGIPGVVQALDISGIINIAEKNNALVVLAPAIGDYMSRGSHLFYLFEEDQPIKTKLLNQSVAIGIERTMQQDPAFVLRILVDIALKAASEDQSDPTTAVMAIDKIHSLLNILASKEIDAGEYFDQSNKLRFEMQTPTWDDYLSLAVDEIRFAGINFIQVVRRLRAMLEELLDTVPIELKSSVQKRLKLIDSSIERNYIDQEDQELAKIADYQGMGSSRKTGYRRSDDTSSNIEFE